jgi:hypothetical protein
LCTGFKKRERVEDRCHPSVDTRAKDEELLQVERPRTPGLGDCGRLGHCEEWSATSANDSKMIRKGAKVTGAGSEVFTQKKEAYHYA